MHDHSRLSERTLEDLVNTANHAVTLVLNKLGTHPNHGGIFRLDQVVEPRDGADGIISLEKDCWIGDYVNQGKGGLYELRSIELSERIYENYMMQHHSCASYIPSTREKDGEDESWAGSILVPCNVPELATHPVMLAFTLAGLPPKAGEAAMIVTAYLMRWWVPLEEHIPDYIERLAAMINSTLAIQVIRDIRVGF